MTRNVIALTLALTLLQVPVVVFAANVAEEMPAQGHPGPRPRERSGVLFFDDMESGTNGWTTFDETSAPPHFHVDTYLAYGGTGNSWWCGTFDYDSDGGYGNSWDDRLDLPPTDVSNATYPVLTFHYRYDTEPGYDYVYMEAQVSGEFIELAPPWHGSSGGWQDLGAYGHGLTGYDDPVVIRLHFQSDPSWSDEDGQHLTVGGACHFDNIKIYDYYTGTPYFFDDVESGGLCTPSTPPTAGDYWHITDRACPAYSTPHSWWCGDDADTTHLPPNLYNWLFSPAIDITGVSACTMRCALHYEVPNDSGGDVWSAYFTVNGGETWEQQGPYYGDQGACDESYDWATNLTPYLPGTEFQYALLMKTNEDGCGPGTGGGAGIFIDDFSLVDWSPLPVTYLVTPEGTGDFETIQEAITAAADGDTIELADGVFSGSGNRDVDFLGKAVTVRSQSGDPSGCIIDPLPTSGRGFFFQSGEDSTSVLRGITFRNCLHTASGGAILCGSGTSPTIDNCVFESNYAAENGGALSCTNASPTIIGCVFDSNTADYTGGALHCTSASPTVVDCVFLGNFSYDDGGGVCLEDGSSPTFERCLLEGNSSNQGGGMACFTSSSPILTDCLFIENIALYYGGALACYTSSTPFLGSCTLSGNSALSGAGLLVDIDGSLTVSNTIISFGVDGVAVACGAGASVSLTCCNVYGNAGGDYTYCIAGQNGISGNISEDPLFCGPENPDDPYTLRSDSPCGAHNNPCGRVGARGVGCVSCVEWDAGGDGSDWGDPLNWDPDQVPGSNDHAQILLDGTYTVNFDDRSEIWALTHGATSGIQTLDIQGGTLTVSHGATNTSEIVVRDPAALEADASMATSVIANEVGAVVTLDDGDLIGTGSFTNSGTLSKTGLGRSSLSLSFLNEGEGRGGGVVAVASGSLSVDGEFENVGRVAVNTGGTAIVSSHFIGRELHRGSVVNSGEVAVDGSLDVNGEFENVGRVAVNTGGTAIVSSHFTDRGPRAGSFSNAASGTLSVDGSLEVEGGLENVGRVAVNTGGTAIVSSHFADTRLPQSGFDSSGSVSIAAGGSFTTSGTGGVTSSGTFEAEGTVTVEGGGDFFNLGTAEIGIGGDFVAEGELVNESGASFQNRGTTTLLNGGYIDNSGYFHHHENAVLGGNGVFYTPEGLTTMKGIVSPGASLGVLTYVGDFVQTGASQIHLELGGSGQGEYDVLEVAGNMEFGGAISVTLEPEFVPVVGDSFDVIVSTGWLRGSGRDTTDFGCFSGLDISDTLYLDPMQHPDKFQFVATDATTGNAAPLAVDDADSVLGYQPIMIPVLDNDSDPDLDMLRIIDVLTDGTAGLAYVDVGDDGVTYAAPVGFEGIDEFFYAVTDCMGGVDTARVTIGVTAPPQTLLVPDDYASIQDGLDAAAPGDTVLISCGTYYESDIVVPSGVILMSETGDPDCVVIDASGRAGRGLLFANVDTSTVVRGITITGVDVAIAGGAMFLSAASPRIEDCVITGNRAANGGALWSENLSAPTFTRCLFTNNTGTAGGGAAACQTSSTPVFESCTFSGNAAPVGGSILAGGNVSVTLDRTIISFGGVSEAVYCVVGATVTLTCSDVYGNAGGDYVECLAGQNGVDGNFSLDPQYCDAGGGDYHVTVDSPCAAAPGCGVVGALPVGCIGDAQIAVIPDSLDFSLEPGETGCLPLTLLNSGRAPLVWSIREEEGGMALAGRLPLLDVGAPILDVTSRRAGASEIEHYDCAKGERDPRAGTPPERGAGGPDAFGYTWIDSDEPGGPEFGWQDITGVGTEISLTDDDFEEVPLPFTFPFYGAPHDWVRISSNGFLTFGAPASDYSNDPIPNAVDPDDIIAPFWTDLDPGAGGTIHYYYDEPGDRFGIQYTDVDDYWGTGPKTFQVALYSNGSILFRYLEMQGDASIATVGIENVDAAIGLEVVFNAAYVHDSLAVLIEDAVPRLTEDPPGGVLSGIGTDAVDVCIDAEGLEIGTYFYSLVIGSNDIDDPEVVVPVTLTILGTGVPEDDALPRELALRGNFPNPFNPTTVIRYDLPVEARVDLAIYAVSGRLVRTLVDGETQEGGYRSAMWDGRDGQGRPVASGVYFYRLEANGEALRRKMILLK